MATETEAEAARPWIGRKLHQFEDVRTLTGTASFVDDLQPPNLLHATFVRSPHAAAQILGMNLDAARRMPGVRAVFTADDLDGLERLAPTLNRPEFVTVEMPLLASERVRHVGEPVAMVVATSPQAAEDAMEEVVVDYRPEAAVSSIDAALAEGAPAVHPRQAPDNVLLDVMFCDDEKLDQVLADAALLLHEVFDSARLTAVPMEGRACLAEMERLERRLVLYTSTQVPHIVRTAVASILGMPEHRMRVVAPHVGGGFGQKCVIAREEALVCFAAQAVDQPVKWVEDRHENLVAGYQGHEQRFRVRAGFDDHGRLLGVDADILCDVGAYSTYPFTCGVEPLMAATEMLGPYTVRHYRAQTRAVTTPKTAMAPSRGVSRPPMVLAMERIMQKAAHRFGLDQVDVRARNLIADDAFPYHSASGLVIDRGSYREALARAAAAVDSDGFRQRQVAARKDGRLLGLGFCCYAERTGFGTKAFDQRRMTVTPGYDTAVVRMDPSGRVSLMVGTSGHGQGHRTTLAQVAADQLGVHPSTIEVRQGDTDVAPYGWGTFASRSMVVGGGATKRAALALAARIKRIAGHLLEAAPIDLELQDGRVVVRGAPNRGLELKDVARVAYLEYQRLPADESPGLEATGNYDPPGTFSNAAHAALVEIDPTTGAVSICRYVVVEDCGIMVNPAIVEGQVRGGVAQGIAAALYERLPFTEEGQPQATSLMDYLVPTAGEIPTIELFHLETPSEHSETGAKGMGEGGTIGAPACIATAVADALGHLNIQIDTLPIAPEAVLTALHDARSRKEGPA